MANLLPFYSSSSPQQRRMDAFQLSKPRIKGCVVRTKVTDFDRFPNRGLLYDSISDLQTAQMNFHFQSSPINPLFIIPKDSRFYICCLSHEKFPLYFIAYQDPHNKKTNVASIEKPALNRFTDTGEHVIFDTSRDEELSLSEKLFKYFSPQPKAVSWKNKDVVESEVPIIPLNINFKPRGEFLDEILVQYGIKDKVDPSLKEMILVGNPSDIDTSIQQKEKAMSIFSSAIEAIEGIFYSYVMDAPLPDNITTLERITFSINSGRNSLSDSQKERFNQKKFPFSIIQNYYFQQAMKFPLTDNHKIQMMIDAFLGSNSFLTTEQKTMFLEKLFVDNDLDIPNNVDKLSTEELKAYFKSV